MTLQKYPWDKNRPKFPIFVNFYLGYGYGAVLFCGKLFWTQMVPRGMFAGSSGIL